MSTSYSAYDPGFIPTREKFDDVCGSVPLVLIRNDHKGFWYEFSVQDLVRGKFSRVFPSRKLRDSISQTEPMGHYGSWMSCE